MSFKLKRWAPYRTVEMADFIPGIKAYKTPGGGGIVTRDYVFPWGGKILVLAYGADDAAIWAIYDPATDTIAGPYTSPLSEWNLYSPTWGWNRSYLFWGASWLLAAPLSVGYYYGSQHFYGWDGSFNFVRPTHYAPGRDQARPSQAGPGSLDGTSPSLLSYQWKAGSPSTLQALVRITLEAGPQVVYAGSDIYLDYNQGLAIYDMRDFGGYFGWRHQNGGCLYASVPTQATKDNYLALGSFGQNWTAHKVSGTSSRGFLPYLGGVHMRNNVAALGGTYWSLAHSPLTSLGVDPPWASNWAYRRAYQGGYGLDENDLDGIDHGVAITGPDASHPPFFSAELGWYVGLDDFDNALEFTVYVLDPYQPPARVFMPRTVFSQPAAWVGEYAVRDDLALEHVLPFPDGRDPSGSGVQPPQVRKDGYLLGSKELYRVTAGGVTFERGIKIDLSSYPTGDPNWWFPGSAGDHYDGFWELFAGGGPTVIGRMPDPAFGRLGPGGSDVMYGLGLPTENLGATEPAPTHVIKESYRISGTNFATPIPGGISNVRRFLRCSLSDDRFTYCESGTKGGQMPSWNARVGRIAGGVWTELINFETLGSPGLGESNWTVWSVAPIPKCRPLPQGGWLVGATLYFDPWEEDDWEWTPGAREATFHYKDGTDSGQGWVPAKPGYIGPLPIDYHQPVYLTGYDEWTFGRSLYGPDALLVYGPEGEFVECLNNPNLYPPDGKEIVVVPGAVPRILFRIYRHGTYSDNAEGWGQYHGGATDDVQAPLYVCYDLEQGGVLAPGAGAFRGFVEMYRVRDYSPKNAAWRWGTCCPSIYDWQYPKRQWSPPAGSHLREGLGGRTVTMLSPGPGRGRPGVRGVGRRA